LPFFESYFSNFIEGTQFGVEEARRIAIDGEVPAARPQDAHDIAATYRIASDPVLSKTVPTSGDQLLELLAERHSTLMAARDDKRPGQFKRIQNYAGGYAFVAPEMVRGTLLRGFDAIAPVTDPLQRAVAVMLLVTEAHPFDDGNGRIARLFANAELAVAGQVRIIIPTVYRNNYLAGLVGVSNGAGDGQTLHSVLDFAQRWTAMVDWSSYERANADLLSVNAYLDSGVAESSGVRLRLPG
jgi:Fic family protein